jgi:recombination protein RecA
LLAMPSAAVLRLQIESALARKIPSALTPAPRMIRPLVATGIESLDELLKGGLPVGAISEIVGPECSGRTSTALSFLARITQAAKVCAWIDVSNALDPTAVAVAGVDLARLLWVRCGVLRACVQQANCRFTLPEKYLVPAPHIKGLHGGGFGPHPRGEVKDLSQAVSGFLKPERSASISAETRVKQFAKPRRRVQEASQAFEPELPRSSSPPKPWSSKSSSKPWSRMEQALRATDLLLQAGGFSAIVLDMGSLAPEFVSRVPLATWFRYRAAAERAQSSILLLTQHACAKSSAELLLRFQPGKALCDEATVFAGIEHRVEVVRRRFTQAAENVVPLRKPPQSVNAASWQSRTTWAGRR